MEFVDYNGNNITDIIIQPNENLLINSDFKSNIINQNNKTTYDKVSSYTLSIDCWQYLGDMQVFVQDKQIRLYTLSTNTGTAYFRQKVKNIRNGNYFLYIHVVSLTGTASINIDTNVSLKVGDNFIKGNVVDNSLRVLISLHGKGVNLIIDEMKLERGTEFTGMPEYNYRAEVEKCYFYYIDFTYFAIKRFMFVGNRMAFITYELPGPIARAPDIIIPSGYKISWQKHDGQIIDTLVTSATLFNAHRNSITIQVNGNFGESTWKCALCHSLGVIFDANDYS